MGPGWSVSVGTVVMVVVAVRLCAVYPKTRTSFVAVLSVFATEAVVSRNVEFVTTKLLMSMCSSQQKCNIGNSRAHLNT
jgi:hypothetical protein